MDFQSILDVEYKGMFFFAIFYLVASIMNFIFLGAYGLDLVHIALVAALSLITAYGLYRMRSWSIWLVISLFFITTIHITIMLNAILVKYITSPDISNLFAIIIWILYFQKTDY